jgi:hypothetical protein
MKPSNVMVLPGTPRLCFVSVFLIVKWVQDCSQATVWFGLDPQSVISTLRLPLTLE